MIHLHDKRFEEYLSQARIEERIRALAEAISQEYATKNPLLVVVLNGAFMFAAQLMKHITCPCQITFVRVSSYQKTTSLGQIKEILGLIESVENREVIIIEDIVDTGLTMVELMGQITAQKPASVQVAALLHKPQATKVPIVLKYVGFAIDNAFVVGYGLDYDELGRNLAAVYRVVE